MASTVDTNCDQALKYLDATLGTTLFLLNLARAQKSKYDSIGGIAGHIPIYIAMSV